MKNNSGQVGGLREDGKIKSGTADYPLVTVITVVYNGAQYLPETIKSVNGQTYKNIEYVVIDGGSTDGTVDILSEYNDEIDYWVSEPDKGISDAFNKGVLAANGDYILFFGASDLFFDKNSLARLMDGIDVDKDILVCGQIARVEEKNPDNVLFVAPKKFDNTFNKHSLLFRMSLPHQGLLTHKSFFEKYGLFDLNCKYSMDYEILLRAYKDFPRTVTKNIILAKWREGGVGTGRVSDVLSEYNEIKHKNKILPAYILYCIHKWILFKQILKKVIGK